MKFVNMNETNKPAMITIVIVLVTQGSYGLKNIRDNNDNHLKDDDNEINDISSLSELPIDKLLILRQSLKHEPPMDYGDHDKKLSNLRKHNDNENTDSKEDTRRTTGWGHEEEYDYHGDENMLWKKTKGNIQSIFQTTVTVLAFLAFGGYLICLIITTVKGNNQQQPQVVMQTMTTSTTTRNRKRRHIGRIQRRNDIFVTSLNETINPDMYALCQIADGYSKYHLLTSS